MYLLKLKAEKRVGVLNVKDKNSRIRIHFSEAWIRGSGSVPKCHRFTTLVETLFVNPVNPVHVELPDFVGTVK